MPSIAGLNFGYFYATMQAFREDRHNATIMGRIAKGYKSGQLQRMALYFGSQPWTGKPRKFDLELARRGRDLHREYCEECHEQNSHFQDKETPPLAGQARGCLVYQMLDYRHAATAADAGGLGAAVRPGPGGIERIQCQQPDEGGAVRRRRVAHTPGKE